ncbi:MAG: hybrid sensor histidine kinase/response regulator, partial [Chloroflexota bacterium]
REKRPLAFDDVQHDPRLASIHDLMRRRGVASMIVLPIQVNGEAVGTMGLDTETRRNFAQGELELAMTAMTAVGQVLERARLYEAAEAQERLAAVGQLSAGIAHDFNNILGVIMIYAEMLQQLSLPAPVVQRIDVIHQQAQRASQLVQQILDFSRKTVMRRQTIDLQAFLQEQAELLRRTLPATIEIDVGYEEGVTYRVAGDATRLQQAVMNLVVNAQSAMPDGGKLQFALSPVGPDATPPTREIGVECVRSEDWILLEVADSGSGIEAEHLGHIFEPFFTTKAPGKGSGLGLAQVYGIVKQHQGHIEAKSVVGQGTTFKIYLPALHEAPENEELTEEGSGTEAEGTVLVVEDNEIIREALSEILKTIGYEVFEAEDGQEAIEVFKAHRKEIGLIISDMVMPRMGGKALHDALRALNPDMRMIFTSGYPLDAENKRFVEESGSVWVNKPFSHETLARAIGRVLGDEPVQAGV